MSGHRAEGISTSVKQTDCALVFCDRMSAWVDQTVGLAQVIIWIARMRTDDRTAAGAKPVTVSRLSFIALIIHSSMTTLHSSSA